MVKRTRTPHKGEPGAGRCPRPQRSEDGAPASARGPLAEAAERPLVHITKSSAALREVLDPETGEIQWFRVDERRREYVRESEPKAARNEARRGRYALQTESARLLGPSETPRGSKWRVGGCARRRVSEDVVVLHSPALNRAHFGNLMICGSVWTCPVCAAKVGERRKAEVVAATDLHVAAGGGIYMVTLTFRHTREDNVGDLVKRLRHALVRLREQRVYKRLRRVVDYVGLIRALEVTHSEANGWHPHVHELWLTSRTLTRGELRLFQQMLFAMWRDACGEAGLGTPNRKNGVTIIAAESAQAYVTKFGREPTWGAASELTKAHSKRGRGKGRTPFDLLRLSREGDELAGARFVEFASAFYGARQLFWSPGLKAAFGLQELSDEEIARLEEEDAEVLVRITKEQWRDLLRRPAESRALVLELAENGGAEAVERFIAGARSTPPAGPGRGTLSAASSPSPRPGTPATKSDAPRPFSPARATRPPASPVATSPSGRQCELPSPARLPDARAGSATPTSG